MQHIILDKSDHTKIIHINPSRKELGNKEAFFLWDASKHIHARGPKPLPEHWTLDGTTIREKTLSEKVADGIETLTDTEKIVDEKRVQKSTQELVTDGIITLQSVKDSKAVILNNQLRQSAWLEMVDKYIEDTSSLKAKKTKLKSDISKAKNVLEVEAVKI
jgi:hypothetical protein